MVTDCSGLIRWALHELGEEIVHHATYQYTDWCKAKGKLIDGRRSDGKQILPGTEVFLQGKEDKIHHCGVYVGDGICIEAKGTQSGVVTSKLERWDHWGELKMIDYGNAAEMEDGIVPEQNRSDTLYKAEVTNPNRWLNVRSGPGTQYPLLFQVEKGTIVDVLAESNNWDQIRSGGRIGWASATCLTPLDQEEEPDEPIIPPVSEPQEPEWEWPDYEDHEDEIEEPDEPGQDEKPDRNKIVVELCDIRDRIDKLIGQLGGYVG